MAGTCRLDTFNLACGIVSGGTFPEHTPNHISLAKLR
jgi:hypothetical protein